MTAPTPNANLLASDRVRLLCAAVVFVAALVLYRADRPRRVPLATLASLALTDEQPGILLHEP